MTEGSLLWKDMAGGDDDDEEGGVGDDENDDGNATQIWASICIRVTPR